MPIRRLRLSRLEEAEQLVYLQQLRAEGHDVEIPEDWPERADDLDIEVAPSWENMLYDARSGGVAYYAIQLRMMARRSGVILLDCDITTDWDDQILLSNIDEQNSLCKLGGLDFERRDVLNSRLENHLRFHDLGEMVEGWLLASGLRPIPQQYRYGAIVPCRLTFRTQFQHEIGVRAYLSVLRAGTQKNAALRPRTGLFDPAEKQKLGQVSVSRDPASWHRMSNSWKRTSMDGEGVEPK